MASGLSWFALLLIASACIAAISADEGDDDKHRPKCRKGWKKFNSRCFKFVSRTRTWSAAEDFCISAGGNLASIHSGRENNFVSNLAEGTRSWIGGTDAVKDGQWMWTDGSPFDYKQWGVGEPNNYGGKEDCLEINFKGPDWNDEGCKRRSAFVCAKDL